MRALVFDAVPRNSQCMRFTPATSGGEECKCGHTLYQHYMCGGPEESACLVCRTSESTAPPNPQPTPEAH